MKPNTALPLALLLSVGSIYSMDPKQPLVAASEAPAAENPMLQSVALPGMLEAAQTERKAAAAALIKSHVKAHLATQQEKTLRKQAEETRERKRIAAADLVKAIGDEEANLATLDRDLEKRVTQVQKEQEAKRKEQQDKIAKLRTQLETTNAQINSLTEKLAKPSQPEAPKDTPKKSGGFFSWLF